MKYPWLDVPMPLEYMVAHCVESAPGLASHFGYQILRDRGVCFYRSQITAALQRLKAKGIVKNDGQYWSMKK